MLPGGDCPCWFCPVFSSAIMDGKVSCLVVSGEDLLWPPVSLLDSSETA